MAIPTYRMNETNAIAQQASGEITRWLRSRQHQGLNQIIEIENVENNPTYQEKDIDLLLYLNDGSQVSIEVKGDRYHRTGNFFFETVSNLEKNTKGCFLYTQADYIFYYFVEIQRLYTLKMPETKHWFLENQTQFSEKITRTDVGNGNYYTTVGRLVPISIINENIPTYLHCFDLGTLL